MLGLPRPRCGWRPFAFGRFQPAAMLGLVRRFTVPTGPAIGEDSAVFNRGLIVISGLPGAGKSTVARALAEALQAPLIDKDVVLEALFDSLGVGDGGWRTRLSRAADEVMFAMARGLPCAILDNWWHHDPHPARLSALGQPLVEIHCSCPPATALERFKNRTRHPGHLDREWTKEESEVWVRRAEAEYPGPLGLGGPLLVVDTTKSVDLDNLCRRISAAFQLESERPRRPSD